MIGTAKLAGLAAGAVSRMRAAAEPAVERVHTIRYDPPPVRLTHIIAIGLAWPLSLWGWGEWCERGRDVWWRDRIASKSQSVREIVGRGGAEASATDDDIIKGLEADDHKLRAAESALEAERSRPAAPERDRCRIPADCLADGVRQQ